MSSISPLGTQSSRCSGDEITAKKAFMASSVSREINGTQLCSFLQVTVLEAAAMRQLDNKSKRHKTAEAVQGPKIRTVMCLRCYQ